MPIFDYKCEKCDKVFEEITSEGCVVVACPVCKTLSKKQLSATKNLVLKGDGFYQPSK